MLAISPFGVGAQILVAHHQQILICGSSRCQLLRRVIMCASPRSRALAKSRYARYPPRAPGICSSPFSGRMQYFHWKNWGSATSIGLHQQHRVLVVEILLRVDIFFENAQEVIVGKEDWVSAC
ncbi:MAG: hypothetical protein IPG06_25275 [Haliea sp.]|nr:hypothetical protein [Haliea sp.]